MNNSFEILAPVGSKENLIAAVYSGANSVYLGVQSFNARASAANFSFEELKEAVEFCHARNVTVNVTLNTILYDKELEAFKNVVIEVAKCGVDAVILQDFAAAEIVKNVAPKLARHASTQMAVQTIEGARLLKEQGFTRVILARELTLDRVAEITQNCEIETEVFVHGALCVCLSGQCYASAFLGGRSGNRGRCAGTCRLPMSAKGDLEDNHLSLKDLSALDYIPRLKEIGVKAVKIEGRLRTPEYVAGATDSCVKALAGLDYDKQILADTFSRSGFTNAFLEDNVTSDVFGVRTREDSQKTKEVIPMLRQLYRREGQYIPISMAFTMENDKAILSANDGENTACKEIVEPFQDSVGDFEKSVRAALEKLGGTPFYLEKLDIDVAVGKYIPLAFVNEARRYIIQALLEKRSVIKPYEIFDYTIPKFAQKQKKPKLIIRVQAPEQILKEYIDEFEYIVLPLEKLSQLKINIKDRLIIELPRDMFVADFGIKELIEKARKDGYNRFMVQNVGHIPLVKGCELSASFTLNISNTIAAHVYRDMGIKLITASVEITLDDIKRISAQCETITYAYGHIPLMLTRACPIQNVKSCSECDGTGFLVDRKNMKMPVICQRGAKGSREIFNPIPIYMGDRIHEINSDYISLNFTIESKDMIKEVIEGFLNQSQFFHEYTRGLYYKGSI